MVLARGSMACEASGDLPDLCQLCLLSKALHTQAHCVIGMVVLASLEIQVLLLLQVQNMLLGTLQGGLQVFCLNMLVPACNGTVPL